MEHSFNVEIATKYGMACAVLLKHISFWIAKNKADERNFHDDCYWTYTSIKALQELFPYMSKNTIIRSLGKLEEEGILKTGNYNEVGYDRTKWYAITDLGKSIYSNSEIHLPKSRNGFTQSEKPIPDINTYINTDSKTDIFAQKASDEVFERLWRLYPNKKGKGQVSDKRKRDIANLIGEEQFERCIKRYMEEHEKLSLTGKFCPEWMHGSTFFHSGYVDYLDTNYSSEPKDKKLSEPEEEPMDLWTED